MTNKGLITRAKEIIEEYMVGEGITDMGLMGDYICEWYDHSDITDPYTLAAVAMNGPYDPSYTWNDIERIADMFFGSIDETIRTPYWPEEMFLDRMIEDNYNIEEIETAQHDMEWW